ncbi:hypothetical protein P3H15_28225 [Rhodococcus sp. T2V]|uniref:hypothetical protein n=1 Tax=Rhodococcus sp. T2V TaxID=3034164 RepID=UPI0023E0F8CF|nr:hypothetical protein [Rhodococcus sp. T2V]MDF3308906.1 hypothetical protein [Rhodococcus sp. T2V]
MTIDQLGLHGVAHADAPALVAALQGELEHSLAHEASDAQRWTSTAQAVLRPHPVREGGGPQRMGHALGQAVASGLTP